MTPHDAPAAAPADEPTGQRPGEAEAVEDLIARAIGDPGSILPRKDDETITRWATRAVFAVMDERAIAAAVRAECQADEQRVRADERETIAAEARDFAEEWLYDGDNDIPLDGYDQMRDWADGLAARLARGDGAQ